jgi:hypothetical protein
MPAISACIALERASAETRRTGYQFTVLEASKGSLACVWEASSLKRSMEKPLAIYCKRLFLLILTLKNQCTSSVLLPLKTAFFPPSSAIRRLPPQAVNL